MLHLVANISKGIYKVVQIWPGQVRLDYTEHGVSSITTADAHTSAASNRLNWRPRRFKWTLSFRLKTKSGFCACAITFQTQSTAFQYRVNVKWVREVKWVFVFDGVLYCCNSCTISKPLRYHFASEWGIIGLSVLHTLLRPGKQTSKFVISKEKRNGNRNISDLLSQFIKCSLFRSSDLLCHSAPQNVVRSEIHGGHSLGLRRPIHRPCKWSSRHKHTS